jgi:hypothetical protein
MGSVRSGWKLSRACALAWLLGAAAPGAAQETGAETPKLSFPLFHLGLFGNVDYIARAAQGDHSGFRNGGLDLFVTSQLSDRWSGLVEMLFDMFGSTLTPDLERLQIGFDHSDELRIMVGRMHSPLVRWNLTIHHGVFLQTPIDRPAMTAGEDAPGLWPVHFVGFLASGRFASVGGLTYTIGFANGRAALLENVQVTRDANNHKAVLLGIGISPPTIVGLDLGVTGYLDRIPAEGGAVDEKDVTFSGSYVARGLELRGEWGLMRHEPAGSNERFETTGWYLLASRSLGGRLERVRPYILLDRLRVPEGFDFFQRVSDRSAWVAGVRWDADAAVAVKADFRSQRVGTGNRDGLVRVQIAFSLN